MSITNAQLKTPGVYINEVPSLSPTIVQVSTAIPAFLGYTEKGAVDAPTRITSLKEFEDTFGKGYAYRYEVDTVNDTITVANSGGTSPVDYPEFGTFFFNEALRLYFLNGGGPCYIISVGNHPAATAASYVDKAAFSKGLLLLDKMDEPTLIVMPEAVQLAAGTYGELIEEALNIAADLKDKFVLIDSANGEDLRDLNERSAFRSDVSPRPTSLSYGAAYFPHLNTSLNYTIDEANSEYDGDTIDDLVGTADYAKALSAMASKSVTLMPPSPMIAGIYAQNDNTFGVWKAPANIPVQGVTSPEYAISNAQQEDLNVDATTGKSINAIRTFTGRGDLVWGARTLAGNDLEWRYIQVRRLFMTVEESIQKAIQPFVFENNDAKTWSKVNAMISSYLDELWKQGALMGVKSEEAFFVQVGLGTTMTQEDILAGRMNVSVGLAAVRPAEFIVLNFTHHVSE